MRYELYYTVASSNGGTVISMERLYSKCFPIGLFFVEHRSTQRGIFGCLDCSFDSGGEKMLIFQNQNNYIVLTLAGS